MLHGVIMAGGSGTRFWPLSRRDFPKQFLTLSGNRSLIQSAFDLVAPWLPAERVWVSTGAALTPHVHAQLPEVASERVLAEPCGRNTAPGLGLAAMCLQAVDPEAVMLAMSADHVIRPRDRYQADVARAVQLVQEDPRRLVLFGARPSRPATGYGYIELGESLGTGAACVAAFKEKPDAETAAGYLQSGNYLWNCGIFVWRADRLLELLRQHEPEIAAGLDELRLHLGKTSWNAALAEIFPRLKSISIDYAVLEREQNVAVVNGTFDWDDVGSWEALTRLLPADDKGNAARGSFVGLETKNCIIHASADRLIATIGIEDCIVVQTPTATLVARRQDDAAIRKLLTLIEEQGLERYL